MKKIEYRGTPLERFVWDSDEGITILGNIDEGTYIELDSKLQKE